MGYTVPTTVATDDVLTAAIWNASVKDDVIFLANPPMASAFKTTAQSITAVTWTSVTLADGEDYDTDAMHSTATNPSRFTCVTAGKYRYSALVVFAANVTGTRQLRMTVSGTSTHEFARASAFNSTTDDCGMSTSGVVALSAGQYLEIQARQNSGGALNITSARVQVEMISQ